MFREIARFLEQRIQEQPHLEPWLHWSPAMETQIMIDTDGLSEHKTERGVYWTDDAGKWYWNIRIPKSAGTYVDRPCHTMDRWTLFGSSGWSWSRKASVWLGFDIDGLNHDNGHGPAIVEEATCLQTRKRRPVRSVGGVVDDGGQLRSAGTSIPVGIIRPTG